MTREEPSLEQHHAGGTLELVLEQRPFAGGWFQLSFLTMMLSFVSVLFTGQLLGLGVFAAGFPIVFVGMKLRRPVRLTVTPTAVRLEAWMGWLALPKTAVFSLGRVALQHQGNFDYYGRLLHQLTLTDGEQEHTVQGLACTAEELEGVRQLLDEAADHARAVQGRGGAEVPAALRGFLRATPEGR